MPKEEKSNQILQSLINQNLAEKKNYPLMKAKEVLKELISSDVKMELPHFLAWKVATVATPSIIIGTLYLST